MGKLESINVSRGGVPKTPVPEAHVTEAGVSGDLRVGSVELEVTKFASPCEKIAGSFSGGDFARLSEKRHSGWSRVCARVLRGGPIRTGDEVEVVRRPT